ncbi:MAG: hypothetical protein A2Y90_00530 [Chloroflexi bacterium RBG_13_52_12]|nr:MAG: hypothetical protein A2Y90_00530 [Chloroflexi bacterium RBG_13_52_12]
MRVGRSSFRHIYITVYTLEEACKRLAILANHNKPQYSKGGFYKIVNKYKPELLEPVITEEELKLLADKIRKPGRPKIVDKSE